MEQFGKKYFDESGISNYTIYPDDNINANLKSKAQAIKAMFPLAKKILDVGCAKGVLVSELCALGYQAIGIDISEYAIEHGVEGTHGKLFACDISKMDYVKIPIFDLLVSVDVLEHIPETKLDIAMQNMAQVCNGTFCHWITYGDHVGQHGDETHVTMHDRGWWTEQFKNAGYFEIENNYDCILLKKS